MCTQLTATYSPLSYQLEDHRASFLPSYAYYSPATTTTPTESFSSLSGQCYGNYQEPSCNGTLPPPQLQDPKNPIVQDASLSGYPPNDLSYPNPLYNPPTHPVWPAYTQPTLCTTDGINPRSLTTPSPPDKEVKRQRYLEKNRAAATKCRSKKKRYIQQLQSRYEDLSVTKHELQTQVQSLRLGLVSLKEELVRHARCGDGPITKYIEKRRTRFV
ncbi:bZIP transcription factor atfD [Aspergillus clavatus NRRL 1]|uniref:BZIP transcription factor (Atf7), putative n=1 Tax=Aspergillus clavatus (strain ATCC 1007 / CBS 513.65 / DSM 816 / NCTC 3887 / NRRL 1 / QM 1276 / 107) TaxID=344612 RepID=A1CU52_ASPCL|nr:bZIP transcription factor (Atf7), putative [Aspergillus clavatus NRRL 1]EAW06839.1 bZIP transcription factor (Atf7), putative [Aspergillus clavatus NRRL 1]